VRGMMDVTLHFFEITDKPFSSESARHNCARCETTLHLQFQEGSFILVQQQKERRKIKEYMKLIKRRWFYSKGGKVLKLSL
jgi:hypothetical protein